MEAHDLDAGGFLQPLLVKDDLGVFKEGNRFVIMKKGHGKVKSLTKTQFDKLLPKLITNGWKFE